MNRKKDTLSNYFGDLPTAYYEAVYKDGQFINSQTGKVIILKDGARVRLQTLRSKVLDEEYDNHLVRQEKELISENEELSFSIGVYHFRLQILEPLVLTKEGNRFSQLAKCNCEVKEMYHNGKSKPNFQTIEAPSLNQAYTQISIKHFPDKRSHGCNTFKTMRWKGKLLEVYRVF